MEIHQKKSMPNYQKLKTMVKRSIDQKRRLRNFDARNEKIETGAVVTSCRGLSGFERGKGICYQWKAKESNDRAKPTPKAAPPCVPPTPRGRSAWRKRSLRRRSQSGKSIRQQCKNFLKGTCTRLLCDNWHPPECQLYVSPKRDANSAQSAHFRTGRLRNTQQKTQKGGDISAVAVVKSVRQLGCVVQDVEPPESVTVSRNGPQVLGPNRQVRFTRAALRRANIRESKGPSLNEIQVKIPTSAVPTP